MKKIYLDNNATTPIDPRALDAMLPYLKGEYGNPSSVHAFGRSARKAVEKAREEVAALIGAAATEEIVFTSGGTEANNLALRGVARALKEKGNHIITTSIEHHAVLNVGKFLEQEGFTVTYLPVDGNGIIDIKALREATTDATVLISVMWANNETGTIEPIEEVAAFARERGITVHTDAVQAAGKVPVPAEELGIGLVSLSAHKLYGPKGVGALYVRKGVTVAPLVYGGHHERNRRAGTENVAGIVGFGMAAAIARKELARHDSHVRGLRDMLHAAITKRVAHVRLNGHPEKRLPNTLNLSFKYIEGESIVLNLDLEGVCVSTGSACTSGSLEPSHVLMAMGLEHADIQGSVRFSLGRYTTKADVDYVLKVLPPIIERLRNMSPLSREHE